MTKHCFRQLFGSQNHNSQKQRASVVGEQGAKGQFPELQEGCRVVIKGLTGATHLNGETGQLITFHEEKGRWGVRVMKTGETVCVMPSNLTVLDGKNSPILELHDPDDRDFASATAGISPEDVDRFKRMAYAFVIQDYYKVPKDQRSKLNEITLSRMVESRFASILEEFSQHGRVNSSGYEFFDAPDSPVPIIGSELAEMQELPMEFADVDPQGGSIGGLMHTQSISCRTVSMTLVSNQHSTK
jgi:hypothetical protein